MLQPKTTGGWLLGTLGTLAIGMRHRKATHQVKKAVRGFIHNVPDFPDAVRNMVLGYKSDPKAIALAILEAIDDPGAVDKIYLNHSKRLVMDAHPDLDFADAYGWETPEAVPDDIALAHSVNLCASFHQEAFWILHLLRALPWIARCEAEEFYYPQTILEDIRVPWTPEMSILMIEDAREMWGRQAPVMAEKTPGRNDPCPCGSGKKYKKCCLGSPPS